MTPQASPRTPVEALATLAYELLDAHHDTIELGHDRPELDWRAHLEYLRALQRAGRALLAHATAGSDATTPQQERWPE